MTTWLLQIPMTPYSANHLLRCHWTERKKIMDLWCYAIWARVNEARIPPQNAVMLEATIYFKDKRKRDLDNFAFSLQKITQDCLQRIGIIPDDTPDHVTWGKVSLDSDKGNPRTEILISHHSLS